MIAMKTGKLSVRWCLALWLLPLVVGVACVGIGRVGITPGEIFGAVWGALPEILRFRC